MGYWRRSGDGREMSRPSADGIFIDGPLTADDLKAILEELAGAMIEQAKREAIEEAAPSFPDLERD